ncbi:hypothetical protein RB595_001175 [Gaeumannomyces hyphopodioides]
MHATKQRLHDTTTAVPPSASRAPTLSPPTPRVRSKAPAAVPLSLAMACANSVSAARLFLQITSRRTLSSTAAAAAAPSPLLDVLLPPAAATASRSFSSCSHGHRATPTSAPGLPPPPPHAAHNPRRPAATAPARSAGPHHHANAHFSVTPARWGTKTLYNPQRDEDGNEMGLEITPRAAKRLSEIMAKDANPYLALRIQVESGGCHGFQYLMRLITLPSSLPSSPPTLAPPSTSDSSEPSQQALNEDDTIFTFSDNEGPGSLTAPKIVLDTPSLELLKGSKVDFTMELIGSQFKIVDNPLATSSCGCGTSFDIKI